MIAQFATIAPLILGFSHGVLAAADCNPLSATTCEPDKALATSFAEDFHSESKWFSNVGNPGVIEYGEDGLSMTLAKRFDNPTLKSNFYIMYGRVEVTLKAGPGQGVVSSFFLQSDDLDEIDLEWIGSDNTQFQSNYFSKGNTATYDRGEFHGVNDPVNTYHNYTIDWQMDKCVWYLDGQPVRTLLNTTSQGYPQTPMYIKMGIWAGGDPSNAPGTIEWAGGLTDYSLAPFTMHIANVAVADYSTGTEYIYRGQSGSWESIEAKDGKINGNIGNANQQIEQSANSASLASSSSATTSSSIYISSSVSSISDTSSTSATAPSNSSTPVPATTSTSSSSTSSFSFSSSNDNNTRNLTSSASTRARSSLSTPIYSSTQNHPIVTSSKSSIKDDATTSIASNFTTLVTSSRSQSTSSTISPSHGIASTSSASLLLAVLSGLLGLIAL